MKRFIYAKEDSGKCLDSIIEAIKKDYDAGRKNYYLGSNYVYNIICKKLMEKYNSTMNLLMVTKDTKFEQNTSIFTNELMFEIYYIWPSTTKSMKMCKDLFWHISIKEDSSFIK